MHLHMFQTRWEYDTYKINAQKHQNSSTSNGREIWHIKLIAKTKTKQKTPARESNWPISVTFSQNLYFDFQVNPNTIPFKNRMPAGQK